MEHKLSSANAKKSIKSAIKIILTGAAISAIIAVFTMPSDDMANALSKILLFSIQVQSSGFDTGGELLANNNKETAKNAVSPADVAVKTAAATTTTTAATTTQATKATTTAPQKDADRGAVREEKIKNAGVNNGKVYVNNANKNYKLDINKILKQKPDCKIKKNDQYQVLIVHTHTTECYADSDSDWYDKGASVRTTDKSKNIVAVGEIISDILNEEGIKTLHVTTLHDYPKYNGSYDRAEETISGYLKKYPSIQVVIDVHRDSITRDDGTKIKPTTTINNKKAAQVMIITGCDVDKTLDFPNWEKNLRFALQLQNQMASDYPTLARPVYFAPRRYNMHLTKNSLLVEFGTDVNTLEEAKYSAQMVGKSLRDVLLKCM
ncbi:MAG: stage II sporulation protein P [Oscillospiraceae bacterium]|nr:stage II sporulation protein P [Oscillospiraceae bacterium]